MTRPDDEPGDWDESDAGMTHFYGDGCEPPHIEMADRLPRDTDVLLPRADIEGVLEALREARESMPSRDPWPDELAALARVDAAIERLEAALQEKRA